MCPKYSLVPGVCVCVHLCLCVSPEYSLVPGWSRTSPPRPAVNWAAGARSPGKPDRHGQQQPPRPQQGRHKEVTQEEDQRAGDSKQASVGGTLLYAENKSPNGVTDTIKGTKGISNYRNSHSLQENRPEKTFRKYSLQRANTCAPQSAHKAAWKGETLRES